MKIEEKKITLLDGVAATLNAVAFTLADVGDVFLCPTPVYPRTRNDMLDIGGVDLFEVPIFDEESLEDPCEMRIDLLESYFQRAKQEGFKVRGVILTNPNNPTGKVYSPHELTQLMEFCKRKNLHVIFNEIYALSTQGQGCFTSVLSMNIPDLDKTHFIWGFSKDFGLSGFRCGVVYSHDESVVSHLQKIAMFSAIPAPTQMLINGILSDTDWMKDTYFPTYYARAKETHRLVKDVLDEFNIPTAYSGQNVIFFWMNLSKFLEEKTTQEERKLFNKFMEAGLYICPGTEMLCHVPGWFRLVYTLPKQEVQEGLRRFRAVLKDIQQRQLQ
ncbi:probable inactive 1-aminocyclopropane-1-carboxylate synthase-like protein 2 [Pecten maximus]|uniref:probable inactive 1-aminocyclopropane-1-carboxylate synthase-like protein 2 n=1 Tax=Pecten maximus TaxID=6579 RepID=UPI001458E81C|nr:probable inactive 1-aminocyclopropane-1-carboxylate synthase-like protein 2 [Pecten maximus]